MKIKTKSEWNYQCEIFEWVKLSLVKWPELRLLKGSLNGVKLTIGQATKAKRSGMVRGWPDIQLPVPRNGFNGLFIELKKLGGRNPDPHQEEMLHLLAEYGNACYCCKGSEAAIETIDKYLKGDL
jgi:hypothetical protein